MEFHLLVADRPTGDGLVSAGGALYGAARECRVPDFVVLVLYSADGSGHSRQARQSFSWASRFFGIGAFCASPGVSPFGEGSPEVASIWESRCPLRRLSVASADFAMSPQRSFLS